MSPEEFLGGAPAPSPEPYFKTKKERREKFEALAFEGRERRVEHLARGLLEAASKWKAVADLCPKCKAHCREAELKDAKAKYATALKALKEALIGG